jgi:hypothetical protein
MADAAEVARWARRLQAESVLGQVAAALEEAGVRMLPVKGVVTGRLLYDDPADRPMEDIDVRIAPANLRAVLALARARAWRARVDSPRLHEAVIEVDGWEVDVECALGPPGLCAITVERAIERAQWIAEPFGHLEPELHDHALILVLNAFKDGLRLAPWSVEDLRRIVRHGGFAARLLVERAREGAVLSVLWIVADWLAEHGRVPEWRVVRDLVGGRPPSPRVAVVSGWVRRQGWSGKLGLIAAATASDVAWRAGSGLALAAVGVARRRLVVRWVAGRTTHTSARRPARAASGPATRDRGAV